MISKDQVLEVWGNLACFSRPEMKVERFSYPVITPSAARGIYDAIYGKPNRDPSKAEFRWQVTQIDILSPPRYIALRRNEVKDKASVAAIAEWIEGRKEPEPIWADGTEEQLGNDKKGRTRRQTMALKNVRYRIHAEIRPWPGFEYRLRGMEAQFRRRAASGKCFYQPYFGCREFPAYFELLEYDTALPPPLDLNMEVGLMLYDVFDLSRPGTSEDKPRISLFRAHIKAGILKVPDCSSDVVLKVGMEDAHC